LEIRLSNTFKSRLLPAELARKIEGIISKRRSREREEPQEN
jgi:hypothetical protein